MQNEEFKPLTKAEQVVAQELLDTAVALDPSEIEQTAEDALDDLLGFGYHTGGAKTPRAILELIYKYVRLGRHKLTAGPNDPHELSGAVALQKWDGSFIVTPELADGVLANGENDSAAYNRHLVMALLRFVEDTAGVYLRDHPTGLERNPGVGPKEPAKE